MIDRNVFICTFTFLFAGITLRFLMQRQSCFSGINDLHERQTEHIGLAIGILSAQGNFEQRESIRETWFTQRAFSGTGQFTVFKPKPWFILGSRFCDVPPAYRLSKYGCEKLETNVSDVKEEFFTSSAISNGPCHPNDFKTFHQGFSFKVHHPVVITSLGVFSKLLRGSQNVSIALLDLRTKDVIVKTVISTTKADSAEDGFLYNAVETYLLPKDYEGLVLVEGHIMNSDCTSMQWHNGAGVISFYRVYSSPEDVESVPYSKHLSVAPSIGFLIHEIPAFINLLSSEADATNSWQMSQRNILKNLQIEASKWKDMLFFDVVDTYRNIPVKLLQFYAWLSKTQSFSYLLKTDDDCFVNINEVMRTLMKDPKYNLSGMWWWSSFRKKWPVNLSGKWADYDYKLSIYPPFPCGGGYLLSRDVVNWLATNVPFLHPYQGEDVSMGVWLTAINPTYIVDERWQCAIYCDPKSFNRAQLSAEEMHDVWATFEECGNVCSCNKTEGI